MSCSEELFSIKQTTVLPSVELILDLPDGTDITIADTINFVWRPHGSTARNVVAMTIVDAATRRVRVDLTSPMVATIGDYDVQIELAFSSKVLAIPDEDFYSYSVTPTI